MYGEVLRAAFECTTLGKADWINYNVMPPLRDLNPLTAIKKLNATRCEWDSTAQKDAMYILTA